MQLIGFNFKKISVENFQNFQQGYSINTTMEFTDLEKNKVDIIKDGEAIHLHFKFLVNYLEPKKEEKEKKENKHEKESKPFGEVLFEGIIVLSITKEESKEITKSWKNKEIPQRMKMPLFNFILKKCIPKALDLEDITNLPLHIPVPQFKPKPQGEQ